jgi:hypothetical protein
MMPDERLSAEYVRGYIAGLERAAKHAMCAPVMVYGERRADVEGGFPKVQDPACDPDGNPDRVSNTYALRDAILWWIERDVRRAHLDAMKLEDERLGLRRYGPPVKEDDGVFYPLLGTEPCPEQSDGTGATK